MCVYVCVCVLIGLLCLCGDCTVSMTLVQHYVVKCYKEKHTKVTLHQRYVSTDKCMHMSYANTYWLYELDALTPLLALARSLNSPLGNNSTPYHFLPRHCIPATVLELQ